MPLLVLLKLSYGILKHSFLHPTDVLILDKETGKVSGHRQADNQGQIPPVKS